MTVRKKIVVDIDGVVAQYDFPRMIKKHFGVDIKQEDVWTYAIEDALGVAPNDVYTMFRSEIFDTPLFVPGAREALDKLNRKHDVFIYTNRIKIMGMQPLIKWLDDNKIAHSKIIFNNLHPDGQFDYHIDDSPLKLMDMNGTTVKKLLFDQPWNRNCLNITGRMQRVCGWAEVLEVISGRKRVSRTDSVSERRPKCTVRRKAK